MKYLLLFLLSFSAYADPSERNCKFYLEAEAQYACGPQGYLLNFGHHLCQKYLRAEPQARPNVKKWFPKVRLCLQNFIEKNHGSFRDCQDLKKRALESHLDCYRRTNFCQLTPMDQWNVLRITSTDLLRPSVISLSLKIRNLCPRE